MLKPYKLIAIPLSVLAVAACDVNQTEEAELPDVEVEGGELPEYEVTKTKDGKMPSVDVEGGNLPEYDVDVADVDVKTEKKVIEVPEVEVTTEKKVIEVPEVEVTMPEDDSDDDTE